MCRDVPCSTDQYRSAQHVIAGLKQFSPRFFSCFPPISLVRCKTSTSQASGRRRHDWPGSACGPGPCRWPYRCRGGPSHEAHGFGLTKAEVPIMPGFPEFSMFFPDFPARIIRIRHLSHLSVIFDHLRFEPARYCCAMWPHHGLYCGL